MSKELTKRERKARIRRGEPIEACGLQFYPITMADYEEFLECKNALAIRLTSLSKWAKGMKEATNLPFDFISVLSMPFLSALFAVDYDSARFMGKPIGIFHRVFRLFLLSLRLGSSNEDLKVNVYCEQKEPRQFSHIEVIKKDGETVKISPTDFSIKIRPLIAEQNGIKLPDESENPELVEEEQHLAQEQEGKLKFDTGTLIASVAHASHLRECEVDEWTVLEFEHRQKAIDRQINYQIYAQAEMSGMVKFKKGNPCPSWCLDKQDGLSPALKTAEELKGNFAALGDIEETVRQSINNNQN